MLDNERFRRAIHAADKWGSQWRPLFEDQEYRTQFALAHLQAGQGCKPGDVFKVGRGFMFPELIPGLRVPYAIEILGMPGAGKSTMLNRYLTELWQRGKRHEVALVSDGARSIREQCGDLRYTSPFTYSMLAGTVNFVGNLEAIKLNLNNGLRIVIGDRSQIDQRVFRRTLFARGDVNPQIMADEDEFMLNMENTPIQIGSVIMMMVRPQVSMTRKKADGTGPILNMSFLQGLYEQYWRLHWEMMQGRVPCRIYTCIDAEESDETAYERFRYAMDNSLNIHQNFLMALAQAFPQEFDAAKAKFDRGVWRRSAAKDFLEKTLGKRIKIVGGDEMEAEDDILATLLEDGFLEGALLRK